jgi:glycosyltransferase involved in cell wall biosynthesis
MPVMASPAEWNIPDGAPVVAVVGRLDRQKDPLLMLNAAAEVMREVPDALFVFAGKGPWESRCIYIAERLGISRNIRWVGWVADLRPLYARMDLLALSSRWEGMPNVVLEAMACRKPVVATSVGGCPELITEGKTGFLVPSGDSHALALRIVQLLHNSDMRRQMGMAAHALAASEFSISAMVARNQAVYESFPQLIQQQKCRVSK